MNPSYAVVETVPPSHFSTFSNRLKRLLLKDVPIMPCSRPHHAPLQVRGQRLGPKVLLGSGLGLADARVRKWTCSRTNSYFDPSVRSDCGSLMSICLAGISLAPGNPTGFLRIGEGFEGCPIRHKHTHAHTLTHSEAARQRGVEHVVVLAAGVFVCCVQG